MQHNSISFIWLFSAHIFFDNAFDNHDLDEQTFEVNEYVKLLISVVNKAAS